VKKERSKNMKALLVRVGIDLSKPSGQWNAPVNPEMKEFAYVPILETYKEEVIPEYKRTYKQFRAICKKLGNPLPPKFMNNTYAHLDPDFSKRTYGDICGKDICGKVNYRGKPLLELEENDILVFYASLDPGRWKGQKLDLMYAIIGLYVVDKKPQKATDVILMGMERDNNAHTRRRYNEADIIVTAKPEPLSGRLEKCIPIGECKNGRYWLQQNLFDKWGGFLRSNDLPVSKLYIQRSPTLFRFKNADKFYEWFKSHKIQLVASNN
jgi:hypothetical protein